MNKLVMNPVAPLSNLSNPISTQPYRKKWILSLTKQDDIVGKSKSGPAATPAINPVSATGGRRAARRTKQEEIRMAAPPSSPSLTGHSIPVGPDVYYQIEISSDEEDDLDEDGEGENKAVPKEPEPTLSEADLEKLRQVSASDTFADKTLDKKHDTDNSINTGDKETVIREYKRGALASTKCRKGYLWYVQQPSAEDLPRGPRTRADRGTARQPNFFSHKRDEKPSSTFSVTITHQQQQQSYNNNKLAHSHSQPVSRNNNNNNPNYDRKDLHRPTNTDRTNNNNGRPTNTDRTNNNNGRPANTDRTNNNNNNGRPANTDRTNNNNNGRPANTDRTREKGADRRPYNDNTGALRNERNERNEKTPVREHEKTRDRRPVSDSKRQQFMVLCRSLYEQSPCRYGERCMFAHKVTDMVRRSCRYHNDCKEPTCVFWHANETPADYAQRMGLDKKYV